MLTLCSFEEDQLTAVEVVWGFYISEKKANSRYFPAPKRSELPLLCSGGVVVLKDSSV